ncbi:MAG: O-antigen ligase family protein [Patescibacteria group bacterium]
MSHRVLTRILQIGVALTFITPLIVTTASYVFPFVVPKVLFLRVMITLLAAVYAWYIALYATERSQIRRTPILYAVLGFILAGILSTVWSVDVRRSLWDNHERMLGLYTIFHYVALYFVSRQVFRTWKEWRALFIWILIIGLPFVLIAWLQVSNPLFLLNEGSDRVRSTLGNTIYVSGYALFLASIAAVLWVKEKSNELRWVWAISGVIALATILPTKTRGTMIGVAVAVVVGMLLVLFRKGVDARVRKWTLAACVGFVVLLAGLWLARDTTVIRNQPFLNRMTHLSLTEGTGRTRIMTWSVAIEAWKEHPVQGWGLNTFYFAFNEHFDPEFLRFGDSETWFDNAHNIVFNTLTTQGVVGLVAYLALFVCAYIGAVRIGKESWEESLVLQMFLVAYFVHNLFVFDNVTSYLAWFVLLAYIDRRSALGEQELPRLSPTRTAAPGVAIVAVLVAVLLIYQGNVRTAQANASTLLALQHLMLAGSNQNPQQAVPLTREAMRLYAQAKSYQSPHDDDITREFATALVRFLNAATQASTALAKSLHSETYTVVLPDLEAQLQKRPFELRIAVLRAQMLQQEAIITNNAARQFMVLQVLEQARALSPKRQQLLYEVAQAQLVLRNKPAAEAAMKEAIALDPAVGQSYWRAAMLYAAFDDAVASAEMFREVRTRRPETMTEQARQVAIQVAKVVKDEELARFYELLVRD